MAFELALGANNARDAYSKFMDEYAQIRRKDGLSVPNYSYDKHNWRYILGLPPDFLLDETSLQYEDYNPNRDVQYD